MRTVNEERWILPHDDFFMKSDTRIDEYKINNIRNYLPFSIRMELSEDYLEIGQDSISRQYFEKMLASNPVAAQNMIQNLYYDAVRYKCHVMSWNIIVILSQLPYEKMIPWASFLALAATRNSENDIQELGIRCYENWEDIAACSFLQQCSFTEKWLQEYADEVCQYVMEEGKEYALPEENQPWKMAERRNGGASYFERYSSGYSDSGIQDGSQQIIGMGSRIA